jgi:hypothetical protein
MGSLAGGLIGGGLSLVGGILGGRSAESAANTTAAAQLQAARIAADAQKFRPVGVTTGFGSSQFGFDSKGNLTSAGYTLSPELQELRDYVMQQTQLGKGDVDSLLGLGRQYLATSPEEARQEYLTQQYGLLNPTREAELNRIRSGLQRTGRGGLAVGQGGALAASNPELQAYYNSLAQQDLQLGANAEQEARNRIAFGQGLLSTAYSPIQSGLGVAGSIEELGQNALNLGSALGGRVTAGNAAAGSLLGSGIAGAAQTRQAANFNPLATAFQGLGSNQQFTNAAGNWFNSIISPTPYSGRGTIYSNDPGSYTGFDY